MTPTTRLLCATLMVGLMGSGDASAVSAPKMKMTTPIPESIITPESVETRLGTLKFFDGFPDDATSELLYDNLDFMRGVEAFLNAMPGASIEAFRVGLASQGADNNQSMLIFEDLMDSHSLFLTGNTESIYNLMWWAHFRTEETNRSESEVDPKLLCANSDAKKVADCQADILVLGDSHSVHSVETLRQALGGDKLFVGRWSLPGCPPLFGAYKIYNARGLSKRQERCRKLIGQWEREIQNAPTPIIALAARWAWLSEGPRYGNELLRAEAMVRSPTDPYTMDYSRKVIREQLAYTVGSLIRSGKKVIILGQVPLRSSKAKSCFAQHQNEPDVEQTCQKIPVDAMIERLRFMDETIKAEVAKHPSSVASFLPSHAFCTTDRCRFVEDGKPLYTDSGHLNEDGARFLARQLDGLRNQILAWLNAGQG